MKTKLKYCNKSFSPININITIESAEELRKFLILTSSASIDDLHDISEEVGIGSSSKNEIAHFVDAMISVEQWRQLYAIYDDSVDGK